MIDTIKISDHHEAVDYVTSLSPVRTRTTGRRVKAAFTSAWSKVFSHVYNRSEYAPQHSEACGCGLVPEQVEDSHTKQLRTDNLLDALEYLEDQQIINDVNRLNLEAAVRRVANVALAQEVWLSTNTGGFYGFDDTAEDSTQALAS